METMLIRGQIAESIFMYHALALHIVDKGDSDIIKSLPREQLELNAIEQTFLSSPKLSSVSSSTSKATKAKQHKQAVKSGNHRFPDLISAPVAVAGDWSRVQSGNHRFPDLISAPVAVAGDWSRVQSAPPTGRIQSATADWRTTAGDCRLVPSRQSSAFWVDVERAARRRPTGSTSSEPLDVDRLGRRRASRSTSTDWVDVEWPLDVGRRG
nr:hypothetical protein Iba_chr07eCG8550 [Ipomoea batatas]